MTIKTNGGVMKRLFLAFSVAALTLFSNSAFAADKETKAEAPAKKEAAAPLINYKPRPGSIGKPSVRVGGATRGIMRNVVSITALSPDHTGLTVSEQPSLCWYLSGKARTRLGITINDETSSKPLLEKEFDDGSEGGIRCISLSSYGVSLFPGIEYQWFAAIIHDPEQRSKDVVSSGMIKRIAPEKELSARLASTRDELEKIAIYASEGIWYDALFSLSGLIEKKPGDKKLRELRAGLLEQVGLNKAAAFDRK